LFLIDDKERHPDPSVEENKEHSKPMPNFKLDNDFLNLFQNEIANLKFSQFPITKDDLMTKQGAVGDKEVEVDKPKTQNGFYDILGLR
jgi:hypothetical protein